MLAKATKIAVGAIVLLLVAAPVPAETHENYQVVNPNGKGTWPDNNNYPVALTGVILNNPEEMVYTTANFISWQDSGNYTYGAYKHGAQWQIFIQPTDGTDHAATALYLGQNYGCLFGRNDDSYSYTNDQWNFEMLRLNYVGGDPFNGHHFRKGDLVQVVGNIGSPYGGKTNVNEMHSKLTTKDFAITLDRANAGLPIPELIASLSVLDVEPLTAGDYDSNYPWFDSSRETGAEFYQGRRVRINGLTLTDSSGWADSDWWDDRVCTATDGDGRELTLRMPRFSELDLGAVPGGEFDAIGIFNQESGSLTEGRDGYELYVTEVVPEPTSISLLAIGAVVMLRRRRRSR